MATQKFSAIQRQAIWEAHGKKCAYSEELVSVSDMHIDHIIPESMADDLEAIGDLKRKLGLPGDFDIFGYENLLPCRPGKNLTKSGAVFETGQIQYFLGIARSKRDRIVKKVNELSGQQLRGRALILLQRCLEAGQLSAEEVADLLVQHDTNPAAIFELVEAMHFADSTEISELKKSDVDELRRRPVKFGANDHVSSVTLTHESGTTLEVSTCAEFDSAINAGFYAKTTFDITMAAYMTHQCGLLSAIEAAEGSARSFIAKPKIGISDLHLMPASIFPHLPNYEGGPSETYQDWVDRGAFVVRRTRHNVVVIEEPHGMGQQLVEVARADFNGDGIEDILLFEYCYATEGTFRFGKVTIITRTAADGLFQSITEK